MKKLPPLMGWSTWNKYHQNISEKLVHSIAVAMKTNGLLDAGYRYINLGDCWQPWTFIMSIHTIREWASSGFYYT